MTWREDLRAVDFGGKKLVGASFRGAVFFVESSERTGGRRAVVHEFPFRDDPYVEDLGRKATAFRVEGYVIGDEYIQFRDKLREKLEDTSGGGLLVHPYYGEMQAICIDMSISESKSEGGFAKFSLQFTRTAANAPAPVAVVDAPAAVAASADATATAASAELTEKFTTSGLPSFAFGSAELALSNAVAGLKAGLSPIITATQELATFTGQLELMTAEASALVRTPGTLLDHFRAAITGLTATAIAVPGAMMDALLAAAGTDIGTPVSPTTSTRAAELANQQALTAALRRALILEAARLAPGVPFVTLADALAARDQLTDLLDAEAAFAGDTAYPAIVDLRAQVQRAIPGDRALASVISVTRREAVPSILLAYQLYGSTALELDVVARNDVRHPGFVSGDLQVLVDE